MSASRHPAFFPVMSLLLIVFVFLGFAPTICARPPQARYQAICTCTAPR